VLDRIQRSGAKCDTARSVVSVPSQRGNTGPEGSSVALRWTGTCIVTKEFKVGGTDDVCGG